MESPSYEAYRDPDDPSYIRLSKAYVVRHEDETVGDQLWLIFADGIGITFCKENERLFADGVELNWRIKSNASTCRKTI